MIDLYPRQVNPKKDTRTDDQFQMSSLIQDVDLVCALPVCTLLIHNLYIVDNILYFNYFILKGVDLLETRLVIPTWLVEKFGLSHTNPLESYTTYCHARSPHLYPVHTWG